MADLATTAAAASAAPGAAPAPVALVFEEWYQAEHRRVLRVVSAFVSDADSAQDVTAEEARPHASP